MLRTLACVLSSLFILALSNPAPGQEQPSASEGSSPVRVEVTLADGSVVSGTIVSESASVIVLDTSVGRLEIDRARVRSIVYGEESSARTLRPGGWRDDPDYNSLILTPTSETLPKGDVYYRNFELLFNNFGYAVTDDFNISAMGAFPVTSDLRLVSIGAKYRLVSRETAGIGVAASGSAWLVDDETLATLSAVASFGDRRRSVTLAANYGIGEENSEFFFFVGGDVQVGAGFKLLVEYGNSGDALTEDDFNGVLNLGFRLFWEKASFSLSGFRPLEDTDDDFIAFPLAMFSAHF